MRLRLLIIDSDELMFQHLNHILSECGYECTWAYNGLETLALLEKCSFNLVIMDHQLPDIGGFHLLRQIQILQITQIVILSKDNSEYNRIRSLDEGATDFVAKPLTYPAEFLWRIRAILKRSIKQQIILSRVRINLVEQKVWSDGQYVDLTLQLFQFLVALASNPGHVINHDDLLYVLDERFRASSNNVLYVLAHRLRCSIEHNQSKLKLICTVRGVGYMLNDR